MTPAAERLASARAFEFAAINTIEALLAAQNRVRQAVLTETAAALRGKPLSHLCAKIHEAQLIELDAQLVAARCSLVLAQRSRARAEAVARLECECTRKVTVPGGWR